MRTNLPLHFYALWIILLIIALGLTSCSLLPPLKASLPFLPSTKEPTLDPTPNVSGKYRELLPSTAIPITGTLQIKSTEVTTPTPTKATTTASATQSSPLAEPPYVSSDLIFLSEHRLGRWNDVSGELSLMAANVTSFASSDNGHKVALLRSRRLATEDTSLFNLDVMDLQTNKTRTIMQDTPHIYLLNLSPDGQWIAYTSQEQGGSIYLLETDNNAPPVKLGTCTQPDHTLNCDNGPIWSPDSRSLAWSDGQGVWMYTLDSHQAALAIPGKLDVSDPKGEISHIQVAFSQMAWSPQGRYLKAKISPSESDVYWQAIMDTRIGRVAEVPQTYTQEHNSSVLTWLPDGRLCQILSSDRQQNQGPAANLWSVLPTRDDLLLELKSFKLQSGDFPSAVNNLTELNDIPAWLEAIDDQLVSFILFLPDQSQSGILFTMDLKYGAVQKIIELPYDIQMVLWAPDHTGTLVISRRGEILFVPRDGGAPKNLAPSLGGDAQEFHWLPMASIH
jgi:dipeptidyl aminopeptidase/acylaminoacyl peptidase